MVSKNFRLKILLKLLGITANLFLIMWLVFSTKFFFTIVLAVVLVIYQIISLIHYVETTNTLLSNFLESLRYSDFSRSFEIKGLGKSFDRLSDAFTAVMYDFRKVREEREQNYHYLETVIEHIGIGLISFTEDGNVELINNASKKLFKIHSLSNLNELEIVSPELTYTLFAVKNGERRMVKVVMQDEILQLAIFGTEFKVANRKIRMATIKDIQNELDEKEMESWQKLIRVLTHEIMNSITPIASITQTLFTILEEVKDVNTAKGVTQEEEELFTEVEKAIMTIHKRSLGLIQFVDSYRDLTRIPNPNFTIFMVGNLFQNIHHLMKEEISERNIRFTSTIEPKKLELSADEQMIEQVLINLIRNAIQAVDQTENPQIHLSAFADSTGRINIQISDNGQGILPEVLDKIFVPFFTTKPKGNGIGLSLSRQILRVHGGSITARSIPGIETVFTLKI